MYDLWPQTEPADGVDLIATRPLAWGPIEVKVGERFDYRAAGCAFLQAKALFDQGAFRFARVEVRAVHPFAYGAKRFKAGAVVPHEQLGLTTLVLNGLRMAGTVTARLLPARPLARATAGA